MPSTLGARIRTRRQQLGWTQEQLSDRVGISKGFLSDLENGKRSVRAENLLDLSRALGVSIDQLMTGSKDEGAEGDVEIPAPLARFAADAGLSFRQTLTLLQMQRQIVAHRGTTKQDGLENMDWRGFYDSVKAFL